MVNAINKLKPEDQQMVNAVNKLRNIYEIRPDAPFDLKEHSFYCVDAWIAQGHIDAREMHEDYEGQYLDSVFGLEPPARYNLRGLGYVSTEFDPFFEEKILEDRGKYEVVQDKFGRKVQYFKGRRMGFMPEYLDNPVKDIRTFKENCEWRMDPNTPSRVIKDENEGKHGAKMRDEGLLIAEAVLGGYMYLRSLVGPMELLYMFYEDPELIHILMQKWLELSDAVTARHQKYVDFDIISLDEDICYNNGPLISYDMMREFLFPYYQQLFSNIRRRAGVGGPRYIHLDTDGKGHTVIPIYKELLGMNIISPNEVASGCDVIEIGMKYPDVVLTGGIDKRILASTKDDIDRHLEAILPVMRKRGGYHPTCDHGVPPEVPFENYVHYRRRVAEYGS
jgi:uroporphyrinogen decarboxylase